MSEKFSSGRKTLEKANKQRSHQCTKNIQCNNSLFRDEHIWYDVEMGRRETGEVSQSSQSGRGSEACEQQKLFRLLHLSLMYLLK